VTRERKVNGSLDVDVLIDRNVDFTYIGRNGKDNWRIGGE
jgi:hypothetical protein